MKKENLYLLQKRLKESDSWISGEELSVSFHTTIRTIRNYVRQINEQYPTPPIESSSQGYRWKKEGFAQSALYDLEHTLIDSRKDRYNYIFRNLLFRQKVHVEDLLNSLSISEHTLNQDLLTIKTIASEYHISLFTKQNWIYLRGKEIDFRRLIFFCVCDTSKVTLLTLNFVEQAFPPIPVKEILLKLEEILINFGLTINGFERYELLLRIAIQITRINNHQFITEEEFIISDIDQTTDFIAATEFSKYLSYTFDYQYNSFEINYLTALLLSKANYLTPIFPEPIFGPYPSLRQISLKGLEIARNYLHVDFMQEYFPSKLTHYLYRMTVRQQLNLSVQNPVAVTLRKVHPLIMDISAEVLLLLSKNFSFQNLSSETGGLALLLSTYMYENFPFESKISCTLVCPDFAHLASSLTSLLEARLGNIIEIKQCLTTTDIDLLSTKNELIISLLPIKGTAHTVVISPMPNSNDFRHIQEEVLRIKNKRRYEFLNLYLLAYSRPELLFVHGKYTSQTDVIHTACDKLVSEGSVTSDFETSILARESMDSTAFSGLVAIPHFCGSSVKRNSICILLNDTPIPWGKSRVSIVILMALETEIRPDFQHLYGLFVKVFSQSKNVLALQSANNYEELLHIISTLKID